MKSTESDLLKDPVVYGKINRPDYVSPLDDLAFDLYQVCNLEKGKSFSFP